MKKKKFFMALAAVLSLVCGSFTRILAYADSDPVKSRGNFILSNEELSICASDMDYLQSGIQALYGELPSVIDVKASAAGKIQKDDIQSKGIINYGNGTVVLDSADFYLLADGINDLESQYKANVAAALKGIRTYFKPDGSIAHEQEAGTLSSGDAAGLSFDVICNGILGSQSVDHLDAAPAAESNISAGTAAWVNGQCIIGNGKDVRDAYDRGYDEGSAEGYKRGYTDGLADAKPGEARIEYVYHVHAGDGLTAGGCYTESKTPCKGNMVAIDTGTIVQGAYKYNRQCDTCGYTEIDYGVVPPYIGQITARCSQYTTAVVLNCGKTTETIESATIYYE